MNRAGLEGDAVGTLTKAYWAWASFVAGLIVFGVIVLAVVSGPEVEGGVVFVLAALWSVVVVPAMLVLKGHVIRAGWESRPADPETYFKGLMAVWATLEVGGVLALIGCLWSGAMLPGGLLAGVLLTLLVTMRPSAAALGAGMTPEGA